jgi:cytochrome c553
MNCNLWLATRHWAEFAGGMHRSAILVGVLGAIVHGAALADAKAGEGKAILCDLCHNAGDHDGGLAPLLQAQPAPYLEAQLRAFKDGRRKGGGMETNASAMSDEDMRDISEYFAGQRQPQTPFRADAAKAALGKQKADQLDCASCHQADYFGKDDTPRLAGQWADYLMTQFKNFRSTARPHGSAAATDTTRNPTVEDGELLAHFFAALR